MISRRAFVHRAAVAVAASALPAHAVWPARGARRGGAVRLVFFTDVHARLEWDTPVARASSSTSLAAGLPTPNEKRLQHPVLSHHRGEGLRHRRIKR